MDEYCLRLTRIHSNLPLGMQRRQAAMDKLRKGVTQEQAIREV